MESPKAARASAHGAAMQNDPTSSADFVTHIKESYKGPSIHHGRKQARPSYLHSRRRHAECISREPGTWEWGVQFPGANLPAISTAARESPGAVGDSGLAV